MYQVFQDDKPADSSSFPELSWDSWKNSKFDDFDKAVEYAYLWAYPISSQNITKDDLFHDMKLNVPVDMGISKFPVMMVIREVVS